MWPSIGASRLAAAIFLIVLAGAAAAQAPPAATPPLAAKEVEKSVADLRAELAALDPKEAHPRAKLQAELGMALFADSQGLENEPARLQLAESARVLRQSLEIYTKEEHPAEWGDAQNVLGHVLREQFLRSGADSAGLLDEAIAAYQAALSVRLREQAPIPWLLIKNNIGTAKQLLATVKEGEQKAELLRQGYASVGEALEVATPASYPQFWAPLRENQLGILIDQGENEKAAQAIVEILGLPPELGVQLQPSLLQVLDQLPADLRDDPSELVARLREALSRSLNPTLQDQHGGPAEDPAAAPPATAGGS